MKPFSMIAAVDDALGIGRAGKVPWHVPADLRFFKYITTVAAPGKVNAVVMGRATWESLAQRVGERPSALPTRLNIVLSSKLFLHVPEPAIVARSLDVAMEAAQDGDWVDKVFVIGGESVYQQALDTGLVDTLWLTRITGNHECDRHFPASFTSRLQLDCVIISGQPVLNHPGFSIQRWVRK